MVEPSHEASGTAAIAVGSQLSGVVTKVWVHIGQEVKAGTLLFELDQRQVEADLLVRKASLESAQAQVGVAEASLRQARDQRERGLNLVRSRAISEQDMVILEEAFHTAQAQRTLAPANVKQAQTQVEQDKTQLDLLKVRAIGDGTVLQVNVRPGEFVSTMSGQSLIVMGNVHPLHVRVNIDEEDLPRLKLNAPARAKIRGDARQSEISLRFVRLEPFVVPKVSLTGINIERVDTRVVQLIYALDSRNKLVLEKKVLVGQIVDVFIDTR
jgi:RND family efflux transporter MFP subunit